MFPKFLPKWSEISGAVYILKPKKNHCITFNKIEHFEVIVLHAVYFFDSIAWTIVLYTES